jgi:hypothetical protein
MPVTGKKVRENIAEANHRHCYSFVNLNFYGCNRS